MKKIKLAIQKSGRLYEDSISLLKECGIKISKGNYKLKAEVSDFPIEILFLRDDDIPQYIEDNVADLGIVGENVLVEKNKNIAIISKLGFSKCRLSIAIPKLENFTDRNYLTNKKIATSYPFILQQYLNTYNIQAEIHTISGSVEIAPSIGLADVICDLVSSGSTLFMNGLKEIETILESEAVLAKSIHLDSEKLAIIDKLLIRIEAVKRAKKYQYVLLNAPNNKIQEIISLLPGMRSPTILPLANNNWSSIHSVISEQDFWNKIEQLKNLGAEGIIVIPIEKMIL